MIDRIARPVSAHKEPPSSCYSSVYLTIALEYAGKIEVTVVYHKTTNAEHSVECRPNMLTCSHRLGV